MCVGVRLVRKEVDFGGVGWEVSVKNILYEIFN